MQFIESSIIELRSAVITMTHRTSPLRFTLFPMVHVSAEWLTVAHTRSLPAPFSARRRKVAAHRHASQFAA